MLTEIFNHWLFLSLLCAFALAASDAVAKKYLSHLDFKALTLTRLALAGMLMLPLTIQIETLFLPAAFWLWMAITVPAEILAMYLYMKAIRDYPLSLTVPYLAFTPMFAVLIAWLILHENISGYGFTGIAMIITGAWFLNLPETEGLTLKTALKPFRYIFTNPGSRYMLIAAIIYSFTAVSTKAAMQYMPANQFGAFYYLSVGLVALLLFGRGGYRQIRLNLKPALVVALLMAIMVYLHFLALEKIEVAYMISAKRTSLLFGIIFGVLFFREKHLGMHLFAGCLMLAGVAIIGLL